MNNCLTCGGVLIKLEELSDSWVTKYKCEVCAARYKEIQPDHMSGNHNPDIIKLDKPFEEETLERTNYEHAMDEFMNQGAKVETTIIKRYQNRKLYDTNQSCYVTLEEIGELIKAGQNIQVIDNKSKADITALTLFQVVTEREKKKILTNTEGAMSVFGLTEVIRNG